MVLGLSLGCIGCGSETASGSDIPADFPTVAATGLDGVYEITSVETDAGGGQIDFAATPTVAIDVVTGSLTVDTACNRHLGSFTLDEGGRASFTLTGGTTDECPAELAARDDLLVQVLAGTRQWVAVDDDLLFEGDAGSMSWSRS